MVLSPFFLECGGNFILPHGIICAFHSLSLRERACPERSEGAWGEGEIQKLGLCRMAVYLGIDGKMLT